MKVELRYQEAHDPNAVMVFEADQDEAKQIVMAMQNTYDELVSDTRGAEFVTIKVPIKSLPQVDSYGVSGIQTSNLSLSGEYLNEEYALKLVHEAIALLHHVREQKQPVHAGARVLYEDAAFLHAEAGKYAQMLFDIFEDHDKQTREDIDAFLQL